MKIGLVCTHGGHLTETLQLLDALQGHEIFFATHNSIRNQDILSIAPAYFSNNIDGNLLRFIKEFGRAYSIIKTEKPHILISLGAEIAIPFFIIGKLFGVKLIYIESWCKIETLSLTGKIVYPIVDEFWVQWPGLLTRCGKKALFNGAVI
jgi:beta-1,4-N-acetylglucosaminyltransferase